MARDMVASLNLRLSDSASPGLNRLNSLLSRLGSIGRQLGLPGLARAGGDVDRLSGGVTGLNGRLSLTQRAVDAVIAGFRRLGSVPMPRVPTPPATPGARGGMGDAALLGAAAGGVLAMPTREAAAMDAALRSIAITAGATGAEVEAMIGRQLAAYQALALQTGQTSAGLVQGANVLVAAGLQPDVIERLMPTIARVATASGAAMDDLAQTAFQLTNTLRIAPEDMERAMAMLVTAGKEGQFELADMARFFPLLTAQAQTLGLTGAQGVASLAAMLQVARQGAGTAGEAATNLSNFLQKITSEETVKNFREAGVDIERVVMTAMRTGGNAVEAVAEHVRRLAANNPFALNKLFADQQVGAFLRAMLGNADDYIRIRDRAAQATTAIIGTDFASRMRGASQQMVLSGEMLTQIARRAGLAWMEMLGPVNDGLEAVMAAMAWMDAEVPGSVDGMLRAAGVALVLAASLGVLGFVAGPVAAGFRLVAVVLRPLTLLIRALLSPIGTLRVAFMALASIAGALGAPVWAVAAAIGAAALLIGGAAYAIWSRWEDFAPLFGRMWAAVQQIFRDFAVFLLSVFAGDMEGAVAALGRIWAGLGDLASAAWEVVRGVFRVFGEWIAEWAPGLIPAVTGAWESVTGFFGELLAGWRASFDDLGRWWTAWSAWATEDFRRSWQQIQDFFDPIVQAWQAPFDRFVEWLRGLPGRVRDALSDLPGVMAEMIPEWIRRPFTAQIQLPQAGQVQLPPGAQLPPSASPQLPQAGADGPGGQAPPPTAAQRAQGMEGRIVVEAAPGSRVREAQSNNPQIPLLARPGAGAPQLNLGPTTRRN